MICTRSHLVCCEGCMFFLLVLAPGTFRRESSTSLLGTQPLCPRRPSSAKEHRHSPFSPSASKRSDVPKRAEATCLTEAATWGAKPATSLASWK